jgi:WD40 repeat protein/serine/threonine protein kinase
MADLVGERYEPLAVVACGAEGEVVRALDHLSGRTVALQVRHLVSAGELDGLVSEAHLLLDVVRHPNLPLVREHFLLDDSYYLVMDWTPGLGLHRVLEADGVPGLPFERVLEYLIQVAGALEHLHHQKSPVVHQSLEPAHLILTEDGRVVLVGFGLSSRWGMSPPGGDPPTPAADIYSLAVTAHTLLTGSPPGVRAVPRFSGLSDAEAEGVVRALRRALDADPARRPTSPSALVEEIFAGATTLMPPPADIVPLPEPEVLEEPAEIEGTTEQGREGPPTTDPWPLEEAGTPFPSQPAPTTADLLPLKRAGTPFPSQPAPTTADLLPLKKAGTPLPSRPAPTTADLWAFAALRARSRPVEKEVIPLHPVPAGNAELGPERSRLERAARSSRLRGALAVVLVLLVGVSLLQVRAARADRDQLRRLQLASVAHALAARVDGELAAGRHERAALLARQADLFDRQTGTSGAPEVNRALRAALTAPHFSRVMARAKGGMWSVALSPDGTRLATASSAVRLLDLRARDEPAVALSGHIGTISSVAFSPDGKTLATGGDDTTARLWSVSRPGAVPARLEGHTDRLTSLAFGFAGQRLATASRDGTVRLWDLGTTPPVASVLSGHTGAVTAVAFSADGARLATGGIDGQVRIWDVVQPAAVATLPAGAGVAAVAFSPDGRYLATAGEDRLVRLWDLGQPGAVPRVLAGHDGPVATVAFSADGNTLASGSGDGTIRLWPLAGETPTVLTGHTGPVSSVAFSPDGETLASASADGTARLWRLGEPSAARALRANPDIDHAVLADLVCQEVGRNLTRSEWREFVGSGVDYQGTCPRLPAA